MSYQRNSLLRSIVMMPIVTASGMSLAGSALAAPVLTSPAVKARPARPMSDTLYLAHSEKTPYVIALAEDAIPAERTAARELSDYLQKISGAKFVVKPEKQVKPTAPQILVGSGARVKNLLPALNWDALGTDGIVIKTVGKNLILAGGRPRGSLYAVYSFLEDQMGVRWWTPTESRVPASKTLKLARQDIVYTPQIRIREPYYSDVQRDAKFATRLKVNGHHQNQSAEWGGRNRFADFVHSFGTLLSPAKYQKEHPEWFSDPENGNKPCTTASRIFGNQESQPSLTNEAARKELTRNALELLRNTPGATMISISQNDNNNRFMGSADLAIEAEEGSPAGPLLRFVNAVAEDIEKEFPHVLVETLAYEYTRKPPKHVRPRHNVVIRLCTDHVDYSQGMARDKGFRELIDGWKKIAPQLYIWNYTTNFHNVIFPHPNMWTLGPDIRYAAANHTVGLFNQGDAYSNNCGDFVALRNWVIAQMMWDPRRDPKQLQDEFLRGYYGPAAAPHLAAYIDTIQDAFLKSGMQLAMTHKMHWWLTLDAMNQATRHYRKAEAAVANEPVLARRVRRERLAFDHAWLMRYYPLRREAERRAAAGKSALFEGPKDINAFQQEFLRVARSFNVERSAESVKFSDFAALLPANMARYAAPPIPQVAGKAERDIIDLQEDRFRIYQAGVLAKIVDDPQASNKSTTEMVGNKTDWLVQAQLNLQYPLEQTEWYFKNDPWRCYAVVKVKAKPGAAAGPAVRIGLYDPLTEKTPADVTKSLAEVGDGAYHVIDLGAHRLNPQMFFFATPPGREDIESVSVDRFMLIRER